jgi:hypothetical protein
MLDVLLDCFGALLLVGQAVHFFLAPIPAEGVSAGGSSTPPADDGGNLGQMGGIPA